MLGIIRVFEFIVLQIMTIGHVYFFIIFSLCVCVCACVCKLSISFVFLSIVMFIFFLRISKSSLYINKYLSLKAFPYLESFCILEPFCLPQGKIFQNPKSRNIPFLFFPPQSRRYKELTNDLKNKWTTLLEK